MMQSGFKWDRLAHGSTIVDIGGGIGVSSLAIAKKYSHLKLIIQDRETVVKQGVKVGFTFSSNFNRIDMVLKFVLISTGKISFQRRWNPRE